MPGTIGALQVLDTQKQGEVFVHRAKLASGRVPEVGEAVRVAVDAARRANIQRHHTVTHLFDWALHEVVSKDARQRGSLVAPGRMRFDFNNPGAANRTATGGHRAARQRTHQRERARCIGLKCRSLRFAAMRTSCRSSARSMATSCALCRSAATPGKLDGFCTELCGGTHTRTTGRHRPVQDHEGIRHRRPAFDVWKA